LGSDSGRDTLPDRQYAPTATTDIHHTPARHTATTGLTGLSVECSWAPGRGMGDITAAAPGVGAITGAEAMVLEITLAEAMVRALTAAEAMVQEITLAEARATGAAPTTGPMVEAVMEAVQVAATVAAPAVDFTAQHVVSAVVVGMAADAAN
jgi:hypothetical protein